jgi:hypothetical protein
MSAAEPGSCGVRVFSCRVLDLCYVHLRIFRVRFLCSGLVVSWCCVQGARLCSVYICNAGSHVCSQVFRPECAATCNATTCLPIQTATFHLTVHNLGRAVQCLHVTLISSIRLCHVFTMRSVEGEQSNIFTVYYLIRRSR